jgi:hypothetical protein
MIDSIELNLIEFELAKALIIAKKANFAFLAYLIDMAITEAQTKNCTDDSLETLISTSLNDNGDMQLPVPHV